MNIKIKIINNLYYADGIVLVSPSAHGMQNYWTSAKIVYLNMEWKWKWKWECIITLYLNGSNMETKHEHTSI